MNRRHLLALSAGASTLIANQITRAREPLPEPPPMMLRVVGGRSQKGGIGTYCWSGACVDKISTPFPTAPLDVGAGDDLLLDFAALGSVRQIFYQIWPYDDSRLDPQSAPVNEMAPPLRKKNLRNPNSPVSLPTDLPPGIYAIEIFADPRKEGDTYQGFTIRLLPAGSATPVATPISSPGRATPIADS